MSIHRRRNHLTLQQRGQRIAAGKKSAEKRRLVHILAQVDTLRLNIIELDSLNCPPIKYPVLHSSSVVQIDAARTTEGDFDPAIEKHFGMLTIVLEDWIGRQFKLRRV